jgi:hypothetical protein
MAVLRRCLQLAGASSGRTGPMFAVPEPSMSRGFVLALAVAAFIMAPAVGRMGVSLKVLDGTVDPQPSLRTDQRPAQRVAGRSGSQPRARSDDHQVPAGSVIAVKLRTTVGSATSAVGDQADAALTDAVSRDGMVLIPAGSLLHGSVVDALPASEREPRGRVAVAFFVIEHASTRSRAAIKTRPIAIDAPHPADKRPSDVQLVAGQALNLILTEPLLVRIPK